MFHATFDAPDLTTFCRLDEIGLEAVGQLFEPDRALIECRVVKSDPWCRKCGAGGVPRDTVTRRLAHEPFGHRPTTLLVRVRRYRCADCGRTWRQDTDAAAPRRAKISRRGLSWALEGIVVDHLTVSRVAAGLGVSWHTANTAIMTEGKRRLIDDPARFDGVTTIGVDEHVWRHTRRGDKYVTVIIDLTPIREKTGPARLLDMVEGRSKAVFKQWLADQPDQWRDGIDVVAMDGFTGFKTATSEELPTRSRSWTPSTLSASPGTDWTGAGNASNRPRPGIGAEPVTLSTRPDAPFTPAVICSQRSSELAWKRCSESRSTSRSKRRGVSTSGSSPPTGNPTRPRGRK